MGPPRAATFYRILTLPDSSGCSTRRWNRIQSNHAGPRSPCCSFRHQCAVYDHFWSEQPSL